MQFTVGETVRCCTGGELAGKTGTVIAISDKGMIEVECDMGGGYTKKQEFGAGALERAERQAETCAKPPGPDVPQTTVGATENPPPPPVSEQPEPPPAPPPVAAGPIG